ncbi:aminotransferase class IV [Sinomicrobium oceani]|uniref:aminotransferase class IV n=1 Tax=Sinomicrobium oceani TaxID=1150368 RepID=UPI00227ABB74|nr:aminotransferase class IV [Sinomicrobium oceani]
MSTKKIHYPKNILLNDHIIPYESAYIPVFDRGFLFGDGIYEVMVREKHGVFFQAAHLDRLQENLHKIGLQYDISKIEKQIPELLLRNDLQSETALIYIQVTRGVAPRKHAYPDNPSPTLFMYAVPYTITPVNTSNITAVVVPDYRWQRCDIKTTSLMGNTMANEAAHLRNADEAVFVRDGRITEGSHCNIFFVRDGMVYTHPADTHILNGITRKIVIALCRQHRIPVKETAWEAIALEQADEAFLSGTTVQIASIARLGEHTYYEGDNCGPVTRTLQQAFADLKKTDTTQQKL